MTTSIIISGQISSVSALSNSLIHVSNPKISNLQFNSKRLQFESKKEAEKALWEAYKYLREDREDARASRLSYSKKYSLSYDAATATISE